MNIRKIVTGFIVLTLLALPAVSMASTYQFVDTSGNVQSVEASSPQVALDTAHRLGIHSGVMLVGEGGTVTFTPTYNTGSDNYYEFIDTSGNIQGVWASSPTEALNTAHRLGVHSGVIFVK